MTRPKPDAIPAGAASSQRRSATWPGRPTLRPLGAYDPTPLIRSAPQAGGLEVHFTGEDGRVATFSFATLPLPRWHADLAASFARLTGPTGGLRTMASAEAAWGALGRLVRFLDSLARPPADVSRLTARHLRRFELHRQQTCQLRVVANDLRLLRRLFREITPRDRLRPEVVEWLGRRWQDKQRVGRPGYSEREFRQIMGAARRDVAAIRDRIHAAERLLSQADAQPDTLKEADRAAAAQLQQMARTGDVPVVCLPGRFARDHAAMLRLAKPLFLLDLDLAPLLVLGVGLTGRNGETLKELPATHELLEGRAVALEVVKRRRGPNNIHEVVHWEVGAPSRQLHTPGGYYLLLHQLARRGRAFSGSSSVWSIWNVQSGHLSPFAARLDRHLYLNQWAYTHGLRGDDGQPLELSLNRLRTTIEVRTTKAAGGHLPTSARSNSMDVQFAHYLRGDPSVQEWAAGEITAAIHDAQQHARRVHLRVLTGPEQQHTQNLAATAGQLGVDTETAGQALTGELDTLVAACLDINHGPFNQGRCRASFLTCLQCENALATQRHLPALLALLERLDIKRQTVDTETWWARNGQAWLAITNDILPKFTPAEIEQARTQVDATPISSLLDLLHGPSEQP
jgi:hypothetical protein